MNWVLKFLDAVDEQSGKSDSTLGVSSGKSNGTNTTRKEGDKLNGG